MIGQKNLLNKIDYLIKNNNFPRFSIIVGDYGCGKKTLCKNIANKLNCEMVLFENDIDSVRECIELSYQQVEPILYVIDGFDDMNINTKNSLLKLTEEPPNNAYIILLGAIKENLLTTLISRGTIFELEVYSKSELLDYLKSIKKITNLETQETYLSICSCPGDIENILEINAKELFNLTKKIVSNIDKVTLGNLLKISKSVKTTESGEGFDYRLFINSLQSAILNGINQKASLKEKNNLMKFSNYISTNRNKFFSKSLNKLAILDNLLIEGWTICNYGNLKTN